jgi:hypothetical protein
MKNNKPCLDEEIYSKAEKLVLSYTRKGQRIPKDYPPSLDEAARIKVIYFTLLVPALYDPEGNVRVK